MTGAATGEATEVTGVETEEVIGVETEVVIGEVEATEISAVVKEKIETEQTDTIEVKREEENDREKEIEAEDQLIATTETIDATGAAAETDATVKETVAAVAMEGEDHICFQQCSRLTENYSLQYSDLHLIIKSNKHILHVTILT